MIEQHRKAVGTLLVMEGPVVFTPFHKRWCTERTKSIFALPYSIYFRDHPQLSVHSFDDYCQVIKNPVWVRGILDRLRLNSYCFVDEWVTDVRCIWENAIAWNAPHTEGYECAIILKDIFERKFLPVPNSEADELRIKRQKLVEKISRHINSATPSVRALHWNIGQIPDVVGSDFNPVEWAHEADVVIDEGWRAALTKS
jgi:hypothetical protein